jgi:hypothetical protein
VSIATPCFSLRQPPRALRAERPSASRPAKSRKIRCFAKNLRLFHQKSVDARPEIARMIGRYACARNNQR